MSWSKPENSLVVPIICAVDSSNSKKKQVFLNSPWEAHEPKRVPGGLIIFLHMKKNQWGYESVKG